MDPDLDEEKAAQRAMEMINGTWKPAGDEEPHKRHLEETPL